MFFCLAKKPDHRFPNHTTLGSWILSHDNGWVKDENGIEKSIGDISKNLAPWSRFEIKDSMVLLYNSEFRAYPLYWHESRQILSNLIVSDNRIWCDETVSLDDDNIYVEKRDVIGSICVDILDPDFVISELAAKLQYKINIMYSATDAIKKRHFITGGIDSALIRALLINNNLSFENINYEHHEYDYFTNEWMSEIKKMFWGYNQIHHWTDRSILLSGSCGDEFMMRGPNTISLWCAWHDIDFAKVIKQRQGYHIQYFSNPKNQKIWNNDYENKSQIQKKYPSKEDLYRQICNIHLNDNQHWHLGNTMTWSPFHDIEITKLILRLPTDILIDQFVDAYVNLNIIQNLDPKSLRFVSQDKNQSSRKVCNND